MISRFERAVRDYFTLGAPPPVLKVNACLAYSINSGVKPRA